MTSSKTGTSPADISPPIKFTDSWSLALTTPIFSAGRIQIVFRIMRLLAVARGMAESVPVILCAIPKVFFVTVAPVWTHIMGFFIVIAAEFSALVPAL